jgi:hypothetical protein
MKTWSWVIIAGLLLLAGCGGGGRGYLTHFGQGPSVCPAAADASLDDELSAQHLEELYAKSGLSAQDPGLETEVKKWEHQSKFNMPIQTNQQVRAYLKYFSTQRKKIISCQLARSTRYLPMIKAVFQEYGLPEDLAYLAMIESGFNPNARSSAGAAGLWQFIKPTGQRYGLVINGAVDERLDPQKSTRAAARYLRDLYKQFGSWYLAAASYNCGERRVQQKLSKSGNRNFWELSANRCLPNETKNYVPQMIAAIIIAKNPQKFGFTNVPYQKPLTGNQWEVAESRKETTLAQAGILGGAASVHPGRNVRRSVTPKRSPPVSLTPKPSENSGKKYQSPPKKKTGLAQHRGRKQGTQLAQKGDSQPYQASIFGTPQARGKHKSARSVASKSKKIKSHLAAKPGHHKKRQATRLVKKKGVRYSKTQGHHKKRSSHRKAKLAKTKSKRLLLSQNR